MGALSNLPLGGGVGEILQAKAYKISPRNIHPLAAMGPSAADLFVTKAALAFFPSIMLNLSTVPNLGPESDGLPDIQTFLPVSFIQKQSRIQPGLSILTERLVSVMTVPPKLWERCQIYL